MAAWRGKYKGNTRSALKVSRKTWFHWRTTSVEGRQRSSSDSTRSARRLLRLQPGVARGTARRVRDRKFAHMVRTPLLKLICGYNERVINPARRSSAGKMPGR